MNLVPEPCVRPEGVAFVHLDTGFCPCATCADGRESGEFLRGSWEAFAAEEGHAFPEPRLEARPPPPVPGEDQDLCPHLYRFEDCLERMRYEPGRLRKLARTYQVFLLPAPPR